MTFENCGGPFALTPQHTISCWECEPTTKAETTVIAHLLAHSELYVGKRLLHVGIGNCSLPGALVRDLAYYVGLTISLPEKQLFEEKFPAANGVRSFLANKYDPRTYDEIEGTFDLIVDVNLKSYACCEAHFKQLMAFYKERLNVGASLVTAESGLLWGWSGNTNKAYTPGAQPDPSIAKQRILGVDGLARLSRDLGLTLGWTRSTSDHGGVPARETLWTIASS